MRSDPIRILSLALLFIGVTVRAGVVGYDRPLINPDGQVGIYNTLSAHTMGTGRIALGMFASGISDGGFLLEYERWNYYTAPESSTPEAGIYAVAPYLGIGLSDYCDLAVSLPVNTDMLGNQTAIGLGDLRSTVKIGTNPASRIPVVDLAVLGGVHLPTGSATAGFFPRQPYYFVKDSLRVDSGSSPADTAAIPAAFFSSGRAEFETRLLLTFDGSALRRPVPLSLHLNGGVRIIASSRIGNALLLDAAAVYRPVPALALFTEIGSVMRMENAFHGFDFEDDPFHLTPGFTLTLARGFTMTVGGTMSFASRSSPTTYLKTDMLDSMLLTTRIEPKTRFFVRIGWSGIFADRDRDEDGIFDRRDRCPEIPEDFDGFKDDDGCPDYDNDGDGIPDSLDLCPNVPDDGDTLAAGDGCPESDFDRDGIPDTLDACPSIAEDIDGFEDEDGCPDLDNDGDGVPDLEDRCPDVAAKPGSADGCPSFDRDGDGVPDSVDRCPDSAGIAELHGCPKVETLKGAPEIIRARPIGRGRVILNGVGFTGDGAKIDPFSYPTLDRVVASMADWPEIRIEIQGHTDNVGDEWGNVQLSKRRAGVVRDYFILRGIAPERLSVVGKGGSDPIADNATAEGRTMNMRIELRRTDPQ